MGLSRWECEGRLPFRGTADIPHVGDQTTLCDLSTPTWKGTMVSCSHWSSWLMRERERERSHLCFSHPKPTMIDVFAPPSFEPAESPPLLTCVSHPSLSITHFSLTQASLSLSNGESPLRSFPLLFYLIFFDHRQMLERCHCEVEHWCGFVAEWATLAGMHRC